MHLFPLSTIQRAFALTTLAAALALGAFAPPALADAASDEAQLVLETGGFSTRVHNLAFSPDGTLLAAAGEKVVRIFDLQRGALRTTLRGFQERSGLGDCYALAFSPDGQELVVGVNDYSENGSLRVYDTANFEEIKELVPGHRVPVRHIAFSRDGKSLASAGDDGEVIVWDWFWRRPLVKFRPTSGDQPIYYFVNFPTAEPVVMVGTAAGPRLFDARSGRPITDPRGLSRELVAFMSGLASFPLPHQAAIFEFSQLRLDKGFWVTSGRGKEGANFRYWSAVFRGDSPRPAAVMAKHGYLVSATAISEDGRLAASADSFGDIYLWDAASGQERHVFRSRGRPMYSAAFDVASKNLSFGVTPQLAEWNYNRFGKSERTFRLETRAVADAADVPAGGATLKRNNSELRLTSDDRRWIFDFLRDNKPVSRYWFTRDRDPRCFSFLESKRLGLSDPFLITDDTGGVLCLEPLPGEARERREFVGHQSFVTDAAESIDGRFLVTSSTDRTMRLWSLERLRPWGDVDFKLLSSNVIDVPAGSHGERAGVKVGDRLVKLAGYSLQDLIDMRLKGTYPLQPGQTVEAQLERGGKPFTARLPLINRGDLVEPLLSFFFTDEGDWVMWTPQGYYDASPNGDRLIGWHVNRGRDQSAKFFFAQQFKKQLYRPDVIDLVLEKADVAAAIAAANAGRPREETAYDLRDPQAIESLEPPKVQVVGNGGLAVQDGKVTVGAIVESVNGLPVRDVKFLVNGRPAAKPVRVEGAAGKQKVEQSVSLLPGANEIAIIASNDRSISEPKTINVSYNPKEIDLGAKTIKPDLYMLAIGVAKYQDASLSLEFAAKDAAEFVKAIERQEGHLYDKIDKHVLLDGEATREKILDGMDWLLRSVTQGDVGVIFVSGHGFRDERLNFYLGSHDVDTNRLRATGVPFTEMRRVLEEAPCKVLLFADTCHAGGITGAKGSLDDPLRDLVSAEVGAVVFASSTPREQSLELPEHGHGAFARALLDTFSDHASDLDKPADGLLSLTEVSFNLSRRVKALTGGRQHPVVQRPPTLPEFNVVKIVPISGNDGN